MLSNKLSFDLCMSRHLYVQPRSKGRLRGYYTYIILVQTPYSLWWQLRKNNKKGWKGQACSFFRLSCIWHLSQRCERPTVCYLVFEHTYCMQNVAIYLKARSKKYKVTPITIQLQYNRWNIQILSGIKSQFSNYEHRSHQVLFIRLFTITLRSRGFL